MSKKRIVIAEDNLDLCDLLSTILTDEGYKVDFVHDGFALVAFLKENQDIEVIILDLIMPEKGGTSIFDTIRSISPASKIIIYTGYTSYKHSVYAREADAFIDKAESPEHLIDTIRKLIG
jgi:DNA-binding NtrC family response regulator